MNIRKATIFCESKQDHIFNYTREADYLRRISGKKSKKKSTTV